ncbi:MAG TPA: SDR family NAD(P)-dependent oxidoreductase [Streptosporangiaceae bacterium]|jgi:acyl transferase domain-containing protein
MATQDKLREYLKRVTVDLGEARRRLAEIVDDRNEPVAVIGMACRYPGGDTPEAFWELLREGRTGVTEVPPSRWDIDDYYNPDRRAVGGVYTRHGAFLDDITGWDAGFFGVPPGEAARMDPNQRLLMELAWEGMENAGVSAAALAGTRTAVMVGLMDTLQYGRLQAERQGTGITSDPYFGQGISTSVVAGRLAYHFDLHGPAVTLDTACSSSLVGLHLAVQALRGGECDYALAAGSYLILQPDTYVQGCATSMLAPDGRCKTFDATADGYVMGEGGGLVVLERLSSALRNGRRIRAVIRGSAVNQDGRSNGLTAPSRSAQVDVIRQALAVAKVDPADVDYVEAHGSGTKLGDAIELSALHDVFGGRTCDRPLHVGAVKTNIGHTQSAAGVAGLIKTVLSLEHGLVPPTLNLAEPTEALPFDATIRPATQMVPLAPEGRKPIAGVSSFGWSGTNAHLVVEAAPEPADPEGTPAGAYTLPVSAASEDALSQQLRRLSGWLAERPALALADVAHTLTVGRAEHDYRCALTVTDRADAVRQSAVAAQAAGLDGSGARRASKRPQVVFLLPGIGDQYAGLGQDLYRSEPVYAEAVDRCVAVVQQRCGIDLKPLFFPVSAEGSQPAAGDFAAMVRGEAGPASDPLQRAEIAHPFQFTVEYALAALLASWGVTPDLLVGYSLGEYVAACLAGVFTLEDALTVVAERARLIATVPRGRMLAVAADEDTVRAALAAVAADVDIAALNGPSMTVLSGVAGEIESMARRLAEDGVACRPLRTAHAFHSTLLEPVRDQLVSLIGSVPRSAPTVPIVSNHTGGALTAEQAAGGGYWGEHLTGPVRFRDSIAYCLDQGADVFVELGAGQTLGSLVRQNLVGTQVSGVLGTLPSAWAGGDLPDARRELLTTCARLWEAGVSVNWPATQSGGGRIVTLPGYPFQRTTFWPEIDPTVSGPVGGARLSAPKAGIAHAGPADTPGEPADRCYVAAWRQDVTTPIPLVTSAPFGARPPGPAPSVAGLDLPGPLLVFTDPGGAGAALADRTEAAGTPVVEVLAGPPGTEPHRDGRRIVIDPTQPAHYREAIAALGDAPGPVHIAHLWSMLADAPVQASDEQLSAALAAGFDTLLLAVQALGDLSAKQGVRLLTVSQGAVEVLGSDATAPAQAAAHGLARVVQHEFPGLTWRGVDLDPAPAGPHPAGARPATESTVTEAAAVAAAQLAVELTRDPDPYPVVAAWRRGRRWLPDWAEVPGTSQEAEPAWRADGVYLITGGTRGLGMALARHLVDSGVRQLALVSRTPIRDRSVEDPKVARSLSDVAELEAAGAHVLLLAADVGVPGELRAALTSCREHYGALHGIVHAAGVPAGGMVARHTPAQAVKVLAPKVLALGPLAELTGPDTPAELRPELLVLYSSAITAFGGIGEADYCAANTVVDAYGAALAATAPSTRVITVSWGPWQHDDWQAEGLSGAGSAGDGLAGRVREHREKYGFADDAGCAFLGRLIGTGLGSVLAVRQPVQDSLREWSSILDIGALVSAVSARPAGRRFPRPRLRTEFVAPRTDRERVIAEIWGSLLGIDQVGVHDAFFELGGNSLVGLAVVHATESEFDTVIAPATLFGHPTVAEFAEVLASPDATAETAQELLNASTDRGRRRRGTRSAAKRSRPEVRLS